MRTTIIDRNAGYAGLKLGEAEFVLCVAFVFGEIGLA
jgi:hypothetical protein